MEKLHNANNMIEVNNLEGALSEFTKIIFYDKNSNFHSKLYTLKLVPEVYAERGEIYIKLCDFSSAISNFKKAL
jgi:tetratricopeptide (TPR) repeat protein